MSAKFTSVNDCRASVVLGPCTANNEVSRDASLIVASKPPVWPSSQAMSFAMLDALTTKRYRLSDSQYTSKSSTMPPLSFGRQAYWIFPEVNFATSLDITDCKKAEASGPLTQNSPMCDTSNTPRDWRTAWCSTRKPWYCSGMW